jgi:hypothetical protein
MTANQVFLPPSVTDATTPRYCAYQHYVYDRKLKEITTWHEGANGVASDVALMLNKQTGDSLREVYKWQPYTDEFNDKRQVLTIAAVCGELMNRVAMVNYSETVVRSIASTIVLFAAELDEPVRESLFNNEFKGVFADGHSSSVQKYRAPETRDERQREVVLERLQRTLAVIADAEHVLYGAYNRLLALYDDVLDISKESVTEEKHFLAEHELGRLEAIRIKLITDYDIAKFKLQGLCAFLSGINLAERDNANSSYVAVKHAKEMVEAELVSLAAKINETTSKRNELIAQFAANDTSGNIPSDARRIMLERAVGNVFRIIRPSPDKPVQDDPDFGGGEEKC